MARQVLAGARLETQVQTRLLRAWDASVADLRDCDGLLLGAAENSGALAGGMKDFLDRSYYPAQELGLNLPYGLFVSAGNDGRQAVAQMQRILRGYPLREVHEPVLVRGLPDDNGLQQCRDLGQALAAGMAFGIY